jgi:hypothetical protein
VAEVTQLYDQDAEIAVDQEVSDQELAVYEAGLREQYRLRGFIILQSIQ